MSTGRGVFAQSDTSSRVAAVTVFDIISVAEAEAEADTDTDTDGTDADTVTGSQFSSVPPCCG
jgi:hypothetical protein